MKVDLVRMVRSRLSDLLSFTVVGWDLSLRILARIDSQLFHFFMPSYHFRNRRKHIFQVVAGSLIK